MASSEADKLVNVPISKRKNGLLVPGWKVGDWQNFEDIEKQIKELDKEIQAKIDEGTKNLPELKPVGVAADQPPNLEQGCEKDKEGNQHLTLRFKVRSFKPSDIKAEIINGRTLRISAEIHEEKTEKDKAKSESKKQGKFEFKYDIPESLGVLSKKVTAEVSPEAILKVDVPFKGKSEAKKPDSTKDIAK